MRKNFIYEQKYFKIYYDHKLVNGKLKKYEVIYFGPRVGIILFSQSKILLVKQYRYLMDSFSLEIPGGSVDKGESAIIAAKRELLEETGFQASSLNHMIDYYPGLDNVDNKTSIFYKKMKNQMSIPSNVNNEEIDSIHWIDIDECLELIKRGCLLDAMTTMAILAFRNYHL